MIVLKNIEKIFNSNKYDELIILKDCELNIKKGEKLILIGENGIGKTTFLKILGLLDKNYSGEYIINDRDITKLSNKEISRLRNEFFGFFFQDYNLLESETVYYNVEIPLIYSKKFKRKDKKDRICNVLKSLNIDDLIYKKVNLLSGGEKQKICIARAIINDPEVIILDEPTNSLSELSKENIINCIKQITNNEKSIIIVSHDLEFINSLISNDNYTIYELANQKINLKK